MVKIPKEVILISLIQFLYTKDYLRMMVKSPLYLMHEFKVNSLYVTLKQLLYQIYSLP